MGSGRIPRSFIDDLLARADIVEIIDGYVPLKKAGKNYQACCPFHNEKTPSFSVAPDKQFYHCFGCGAHGNVVSFLMEYERLEFPEAIEELASIYHLEVPREEGRHNPAEQQARKQQQQDDYQLLENVARFFEHQLKNHSSGSKAIEYLKNRGLSGEIVKAFNIGFAPPDWDAVLKQFGTNAPAKAQLLALKIINQNDNQRQYDFFRDRIMFPIRDRRGRVIGFGGRVLEGDGPKYLNSPETRVFHKGSELYGLYQAKQKHRKLDRVVIVEGYMDVVALAQFGIDYAVASLGTATTTEHVQLLFRSTQEVICCFDGDRAGREAAWRAMENALTSLKDGYQLKFLFLPDGEDPDTMVRKSGKEKFEQLLNDAKPLSSFFFESLLKQFDVKTTEGKAALKASALPLIEQIEGEHQQQMFKEELAKFTGELDRVRLQHEISQANQSNTTSLENTSGIKKVADSPVRRLIQLLLNDPKIASQFPQITPDSLKGLTVNGVEFFREVHAICFQEPEINSVQLMERFRDHPYQGALAKLLSQELPEHKDLQSEFKGNIQRLIELSLGARLEELVTKSKITKLSKPEMHEMVTLTRELNTGVSRD